MPVAQQRNAIELIEQALVYKFPGRPWRELEAMFGVTEWKQTRFYQEVKPEGRQEMLSIAIPRMLEVGLNVEQIAGILEVDLECE